MNQRANRKLKNEYGLDTVVEHLRAVEGKAAAKVLDTRFIEVYEKIVDIKPGCIDDTGKFIQIQKGLH